MEKLQPLIKHKFWVITGLALLLPFVGWWLSTSAVAEHIQQRWDKLESTNVTQAAGKPNQDYITGIGDVNEVLARRQSRLDLDLYNKQKKLRTWPQYVATSMENKHFGDRADTSTLRIYARNLQAEIIAMLDNLPRYKYDQVTREESGLVYVPSLDVIPPEQKRWSDGNPPTSQVMWETQEDVWLTRSILNAIKKVNNDAGATKITDAPIKELVMLHFRGGSRPQPTEGGVEGGGAPGMEGGPGMAEGSPGMMGGGADGGAPGGVVTPGFGRGMANPGEMAGGGGPSSMLGFEGQIQMNLDAVFGPAVVQNQQGANPEGGDPGAVMPGNPGGPMGRGTGIGQGLRRYVDDDPSLPYKTRGFYLEVYMLHNNLPDLQAALVSMPWPTELLMIHQVSDKLDDIIALQEETNQMMLPPGGGQYAPGGDGGGGRRFGVRNRPRSFGAGLPGNPGGNGFGTFGRNNRGGRFGAPGMDAGGGRFPMGGIGPMNPMGLEGNALDSPSDDLLYYKAMDDFYVTRIGIAGLMTIYRSPEERAALKAEGADGTAAPMDGQTEGNVPLPGENASGTQESEPPGDMTETPKTSDPMNATEPDSQNPTPPNDGTPPAADPASSETPAPMPGTETPPANEATPPQADPNPMPATPSESPPSSGG